MTFHWITLLYITPHYTATTTLQLHYNYATATLHHVALRQLHYTLTALHLHLCVNGPRSWTWPARSWVWECQTSPNVQLRPVRPILWLTQRMGWPTKHMPENERLRTVEWLSHVVAQLWNFRHDDLWRGRCNGCWYQMKRTYTLTNVFDTYTFAALVALHHITPHRATLHYTRLPYIAWRHAHYTTTNATATTLY